MSTPAAGKTALLFGATGVVGSLCLNVLLEDPTYSRVVTIGRRATTRQHAKLVQIVAELDRLSGIEASAIGTVDAAFCCLGSTQSKAGSKAEFRAFDAGYPAAAALFAKQHGAQQFLIVTAIAADPKSPMFYLKVKGEAEAGVIASGIASIAIFRPSLLIAARKDFRWKERLSEPFLRGLSVLLVGPARVLRPIRAETVARALVAVSHAPAPGATIYESDRIADIGETA